MYFSIKAVVEKEGNVSLFSNLTNYKWHERPHVVDDCFGVE